MTEVFSPMAVADVTPSRSARCCTALVQEEKEDISSQRSNLQGRNWWLELRGQNIQEEILAEIMDEREEGTDVDSPMNL
jgi:hypothetical protein